MTFFFYRRDREDKEKVKKARFAFLRAKRLIERKKERYEDIERYLRVVVDKTTTYAFRDTQLFENTFGNIGVGREDNRKKGKKREERRDYASSMRGKSGKKKKKRRWEEQPNET